MILAPTARKITEFEPEITAFYCIYCGYMAADTAGALNIQYPANIKFVRMPCTGKTDVRYLLEAFEQGADGVYIVACPIGNCHHVRGNERGRARMRRAKKILDEIGLGGERLEMFFMSGSQGHAFAIAAQQMTERIRKLGPNPLRFMQDGEDQQQGEATRLGLRERLNGLEEEDGEDGLSEGDGVFRGRKSSRKPPKGK